jgi:hypothetical protein
MAHADASQALDGVSYAVSFDHGHDGIHSPHKSEVGRRLALKVSLRTSARPPSAGNAARMPSGAD